MIPLRRSTVSDLETVDKAVLSLYNRCMPGNPGLMATSENLLHIVF
jgi:hypothetical protein